MTAVTVIVTVIIYVRQLLTPMLHGLMLNFAIFKQWLGHCTEEPPPPQLKKYILMTILNPCPAAPVYIRL